MLLMLVWTSDWRGSVRRPSVVLIWIICPVEHRRFFLGGFSHVCAPRQLPALMVGSLMSMFCVSEEKLSWCAAETVTQSQMLVWMTARTDTIRTLFKNICVLHSVLIYECVVESLALPHPRGTLQGLYSGRFVCMQMVLDGSRPWKPIDPFEMRGWTSWRPLLHLLSEARSNSHLHACWLHARLYLRYGPLFYELPGWICHDSSFYGAKSSNLPTGRLELHNIDHLKSINLFCLSHPPKLSTPPHPVNLMSLTCASLTPPLPGLLWPTFLFFSRASTAPSVPLL